MPRNGAPNGENDTPKASSLLPPTRVSVKAFTRINTKFVAHSHTSRSNSALRCFRNASAGKMTGHILKCNHDTTSAHLRWDNPTQITTPTTKAAPNLHSAIKEKRGERWPPHFCSHARTQWPPASPPGRHDSKQLASPTPQCSSP
jgi:hypothetical protein